MDDNQTNLGDADQAQQSVGETGGDVRAQEPGAQSSDIGYKGGAAEAQQQQEQESYQDFTQQQQSEQQESGSSGDQTAGADLWGEE